MVAYNVVFSQEGLTSLSQLDKQIAQRILDRIKWLSFHIEDVNHRALTANLKGTFKLRVGDYRVIYELKKTGNALIIRFIGHRSEVYNIK